MVQSLPQNDHSRVIVTTMKDEAPYMLDWIAYHLAIGFTHFVILTNDCSDGTEKIARKLEKIGLVTHKNNKSPHPRGPQKTGYRRMRNLDAVQNAGWMLALDVDEYLSLHTGQGENQGTLDMLFEITNPRVKSISFVWQLFGNNNIEPISRRPVYEEFTRSQLPLQSRPYECLSIKTLFQKEFFGQIGTHRPIEFDAERIDDFLWIDADGVPMYPYYHQRHWRSYENGLGFGTILGRINHYALRSLEGFMVKWARGFVHPNAPTVRGKGSPEDYWTLFNWNQFQAPPLPQTRKAAEIKTKILSYDNLSKLEDDAFSWHQERALALKTDYAESYARLRQMEESKIDQDMPDFSQYGSPKSSNQRIIPPQLLLQKALAQGIFPKNIYLNQYQNKPQKP